MMLRFSIYADKYILSYVISMMLIHSPVETPGIIIRLDCKLVINYFCLVPTIKITVLF